MAAPLKAALSVLYIHTHTYTHIHAHTLTQVRTKISAGVSTTLSSTTALLFLHEKETDIEMARWSFVGDCKVFLCECACVWTSEKALAEGEREGASSGQSGPFYISRSAVWDTIPTSVFGLFTTSSSGCKEGGGLPSAVPFSRPLNLEGKSSFCNRSKIALSFDESLLLRGQTRAN